MFIMYFSHVHILIALSHPPPTFHEPLNSVFFQQTPTFSLSVSVCVNPNTHTHTGRWGTHFV